MIQGEDTVEGEAGARRLRGAILETSGLPVERMPGLAAVLEGFIAAAPKSLARLVTHSLDGGGIEPPQSTTLFQAIGDCAGLTAAIYASVDPESRMLIALDDRIDDLIVASIFGESLRPAGDDEAGESAPRGRTPIETALVEEFARGLGSAIETGFESAAPVSVSFERLLTLTDTFALGRRDMPAAAARFSLRLTGGMCQGLVVMPQSMLLPIRKQLEREPQVESASADRRWSNSIESGLRQTRLPVTAILEELSMSLGDVANFRVGGVLSLQSSDFDSVRLECAGRRMFLCRLAQSDGRYRLEIGTSLAQPVEPSSL